MSRFLISVFALFVFFSCATTHLSVQQINTKNISVNLQTSSVDSFAQATITPFRDSIANAMSKLIAVSATPLVKGRPESKLTNLAADVVLEYGTNYCIQQKLNVVPNVSYFNYGGLRASLPQGDITVERIFELMPFENEIVLVKVSGESVVKMAERIAIRGGEGVAGMKIGIRDGKLGTLTVGGKAVDPAAIYWVVTNDYIANGGDQMSMLANSFDRINTKLKLRDIFMEALGKRYKENGVLDVKEDGRIYREQ